MLIPDKGLHDVGAGRRSCSEWKERKERELWGLGAVVGKHTRWEPHPTATAGGGSQHWPKDTADLRWKVPEPHIPFGFLDLGREKWRSTAPLGPQQWGWGKGVLVKGSCHHRLGALIALREMTLLR